MIKKFNCTQGAYTAKLEQNQMQLYSTGLGEKIDKYSRN